MAKVKPKKYLGQHFLKDPDIAEKIVKSLSIHQSYTKVLEIGPGMGVLTDLLLRETLFETFMMDVDKESIVYLKNKYSEFDDRIIYSDFLKTDLKDIFSDNFAVIGNFPYNISSQIFFKIIDYKDQIPEIVCMIQKEVAERIASPSGNKSYGILSVLLQVYYDIELLFIVEPHVFYPPPKVRSAVLRLKRNKVKALPCSEKLFKRIVKEGFQNRRKTLRNALKRINLPEEFKRSEVLNKRAEQLSVNDFIDLTLKIESI